MGYLTRVLEHVFVTLVQEQITTATLGIQLTLDDMGTVMGRVVVQLLFVNVFMLFR